MTFYIKKTFVDAKPGIELVNIHYTWTRGATHIRVKFCHLVM